MLWHCLVWRAAAAHPYGTAPLIGSCACATAGDLLPARRGSQDTVPSICMRSCKCRRGTQWEVDPCGIWRQQTTHILLDLVFCWGNYKWIHCESEYQQGEEGPAAPPVQQHQMFNTSLLVWLPWDAHLLIWPWSPVTKHSGCWQIRAIIHWNS